VGQALTPEEAASFAAHEATLAAGLHLWQTAGSALLAIRDARLFRARAASFEEYCRARWSLPERQAGRLMAHAQVYAQLRAEAQVVLRSASQADALLGVPPELRASVVRAAAAAGRVSARALRAAAAALAAGEPEAPAPLYTSRGNGQTRITALPSGLRAGIICADVRDVSRAHLPALPTLLVADPPYNISKDRDFQRDGARTITSNFGDWDRLTPAEFAELLRTTISWSFSHSADDASIYWFCSDKVLSDVHRFMDEAGWRDSVTLYWHKTNPAPHFMRHTYVSSVEVCVFARKGRPPFNWLGQNAMHNFIETPLVGGQERVRGPHGESLNLAQKSCQVISHFIEVSSHPGDLVLDLFAGTGTTSVAAQQLGRRWLAIERRQEQCRIIEARIAQLERKPELVAVGG
jgi:site-specific DNA-methyltransferase (adenine-specific)